VRPTILVIRHTRGTSAGRLDEWLPAAGVDHHVVMAADLDAHLATASQPDGLILLGGGFLPDDDATRPFLVRERAIIGAALASNTPLFGICLGAQLIAHVAGGTVTGSSGETERGSQLVELLPTAAGDPVFGPLAAEPELRMIQNHRDSITTLPPGAVLLATSTACRVQALRVGERAWGVQFHPEASPDRIATWNEAALATEGLDRARLVADAEHHDRANAGRARRLVAGFVDVVAAHAAERSGPWG
jgi:GMP synthase-like glutamine amidotransferase